ncbi:ABC transporter permease [Sinirhodobacter huangdaonensis]|uniref:Iron ABC transporter permease n=1 Tax=Paenirhodobacter huangdaonensis TaxID=2501515 RepID=A0A3S3MCZ6_9RHOB|nr:ABC transporter permease subunit [Sinirhodobacter huangdaonensis]RWR55031.1 iron ABC transporter permease [Sinirhodobacter huangdaonensis]
MADLTASAARAGLRARLPGGDGLVIALIALYVLGLGLWPLARLLLEAFGPDDAGRPLGLIREALFSRAARAALANTLTASAGSVAVSVTLGTGLALALGLMRLPGRVAMTFLALAPMLIPSQIMALAWIELFGSSSPILAPLGLAPGAGARNPLYSGAGVAWLMGIEHMPLVFLAVRAALGAVPADLVEAARIAGAGPMRIVARVIAPLCLPQILAGAILAFAAAVGNFGVPALLGIPGRFPMLTTLIYQRLNGFGPQVLGQVAVLALMLIGLAGLALLARSALICRLSVPVAAGRPFAGFDPGRGRGLALAVLWAMLGVLLIAPIAALLGTALVPALGMRLTAETVTLANVTQTLADPVIRRAFVNSLGLSLTAAALSALVALPFAWFAQIARQPLLRRLDTLADAPFVVPGTVLALAMILVFLPPLPGLGVSVYGTPVILLFAYLARFLPLVLRPVGGVAQAMEPALDEAARIAGAPALRRIARIFTPLAAPAAAAGAVLVVMTAFNELTLSALLWSAGTETVGVMIFALQQQGNSTGAAALSVLSLALVLALALLTDRIARRSAPWVLPWRGGV